MSNEKRIREQLAKLEEDKAVIDKKIQELKGKLEEMRIKAEEQEVKLKAKQEADRQATRSVAVPMKDNTIETLERELKELKDRVQTLKQEAEEREDAERLRDEEHAKKMNRLKEADRVHLNRAQRLQEEEPRFMLFKAVDDGTFAASPEFTASNGTVARVGFRADDITDGMLDHIIVKHEEWGSNDFSTKYGGDWTVVYHGARDRSEADLYRAGSYVLSGQTCRAVLLVGDRQVVAHCKAA